MTDINYEESYFKLKKSNEDLTTLINKVINDFKQTKQQLLSEKDKSSIVIKRNVSLEKQLNNLTDKCKEHQQELDDLRDEVANLKSYSKAVEGVAENYCGKNMVNESKYKKLKRKSTLIFSKLQMEGNFNLSLDETDDLFIPLSPLTPTTPMPDFTDVKKTYEDELEKEKQKKINLRSELKNMKMDLEDSKLKIGQLTSQLEEKTANMDKLRGDMDVLAESYEVLKTDHESMMECFRPYLKMKSENIDLKRTSTLLLSEMSNDSRLLQFTQMIDELKAENLEKSHKITELESRSEPTGLEVELSTLKLQLVDANDKISEVIKERDTLKHENRILQEQKGGYGVPAPPPPAPPPPPPPSTNPILKLFKGKSKAVVNCKAVNLEQLKIADMMKELQTRLEQKVRRERLQDSKPSSITRQETCDVTDSSNTTRVQVRLRSASLPTITPNIQNVSELERRFQALKKMTPINENT